jgi:hypothetical protein
MPATAREIHGLRIGSLLKQTGEKARLSEHFMRSGADHRPAGLIIAQHRFVPEQLRY